MKDRAPFTYLAHMKLKYFFVLFIDLKYLLVFAGITPCRTDVTVHVKVIDRSMPVFKKQFYSELIAENVELHSPLSTPIEAESPLSRKLIYSIVKGNEMEEFALDFNTGNKLFNF